jgi:hypothetical protein
MYKRAIPKGEGAGLRDRIAWRVANFALNRIATEAYRSRIAHLILLGLVSVEEETDRLRKFAAIGGER